MDQPVKPTELAIDEVFPLWINYFYTSLLAIVLVHFVGILLPIILPKLASIILPSCRARSRAAQMRSQELRELRQKMSDLNMVDNFAAYSKLERKVRALVRQQDESDRSQVGTSVGAVFDFQDLRFY